MSFLRDASDWLEINARKVGSVVLTELESKGLAICGKWNVKFEYAFISSIQRHRNYSYKSVRDLLRAIRNTLNHYREFHEEVQVRFSQYLNYTYCGSLLKTVLMCFTFFYCFSFNFNELKRIKRS